MIPTDLPLTFGATHNGELPFEGDLDEVRIWTRALGKREVAARAQGKTITNQSGLLAHWSFDRQQDGVFVNLVGGGMDARAVKPVQTVPGVAGQCLHLDGKSYVQVPHDPRLNLTGAFTIEFYVRPAKTTDARIIDKSVAGTNKGWGLDFSPKDTLRVIMQPNHLSSPVPLPANRWTHVCVTFNPGTGQQRLYFDGLRVAGADWPVYDPDYLARAYTLQRFVIACAGRGRPHQVQRLHLHLRHA